MGPVAVVSCWYFSVGGLWADEILPWVVLYCVVSGPRCVVSAVSYRAKARVFYFVPLRFAGIVDVYAEGRRSCGWGVARVCFPRGDAFWGIGGSDFGGRYSCRVPILRTVLWRGRC